MTQTATVKRILTANTAELLVKRQSACGHNCAQCGGCAQPELLITAVNPVGAVPGQQVVVASSSKRVLGLAVLLYGLPILLFFVFYFLAGRFLPDWGAVLAGVAGFLAVLVCVCLPLDRKMKAMQFEIVAVGQS